MPPQESFGPFVNKLFWIAACVSLAVAAPRVVVKDLDVPVAMRDGVRLSANVFLPSGRGPFPCILARTPYNKGADITAYYRAFVDHGYAVVVQDVRGRYDSEGAFEPLTQEPHDGDDTIYWIARQPWSNGKVGMMGGSYVGIVQWKAALLNNPHLKAIFPVVSGYDDYRDRFYSTGGAMKLGNRLEWMSENLREPGLSRGLRQICAPPAAADRRSGGAGLDFAHVPGHHRAPGIRFLLASHLSTRSDRPDQGAGVQRGRLVRQFRGERPGGVRRAAAEKRREPHPDRAVAAQHVGAIRRGELRAGFVSSRARRCRSSGSTSG